MTKLPFPFFACLSTKAVSDPNHLFVWVRENVRDKSKFNPSFLQLLSWALGGVKAESRERGPWVKFRFRKDRLLEAFLYLACPRSMPEAPHIRGVFARETGRVEDTKLPYRGDVS